MKILVTGANGYLGQGIVKNLLDRGNEVIATDFLIDNVDNRAQRVEGDIFSLTNPFEKLGKPDIMLHLAWKDGFIHDSNNHIIQLPKHYLFIEKMIKSGLKKISVMGTMHEVGFYEGAIDEKTPCHPMNLYGIAKNSLRDSISLISKKENVTFQWLRGFYIVGNTKFGSSIFSKITKAESEGKKEFPFTLGRNQYDFLNYDEFCNQVALTITQKKVNGIINICSGRPEKLADRVEKFIKDNHYSITLKYGVYPERAYDSKAVWGNNTKIMKIISNSQC